MSDLSKFRDHCRKMATAAHKPECPSLPENQPHWPPRGCRAIRAVGELVLGRRNGPPPPAPKCDGCLTDADRALFAQMAGEIDAHLAPQVDLFGEVTTEPTLEDA